MINKDDGLLYCDHCGEVLYAGQWMPVLSHKTSIIHHLCLACNLELAQREQKYRQKLENKIEEYLTETERKQPQNADERPEEIVAKE